MAAHAPRRTSSFRCSAIKNHGRFGLIRHFIVTHAAAHDGTQLVGLFDPDNSASAV